jgi:hypothetical protein
MFSATRKISAGVVFQRRPQKPSVPARLSGAKSVRLSDFMAPKWPFPAQIPPFRRATMAKNWRISVTKKLKVLPEMSARRHFFPGG